MADQRLSALAELAAEIDPADLLYLVDVSDATDNAGGSSRKVMVDRVLGYGLHSICEGRLTLASGDPENMGGLGVASTIYFAPYLGNRISLFDGTRWRLYTFAQFSLALAGLTPTLPYDVFCYDNAGVLTLEFLAWASATARATALVLQDGIYCKSGALTRRYLGTFYAYSATQTIDGPRTRFLWNYYNRLPYADMSIETAVSWTNAGNGTWSAVNGGSGFWKHEFVVGIADRVRRARLNVYATTQFHFAIARDSSSLFISGVSTMAGLNVVGGASIVGCEYTELTPIGYHYLQAIQTTASATSGTALGQRAPGAGVVGANSGMIMEAWR